MTERKRSQKGRKRGVDKLGFILKLKIQELGKARNNLVYLISTVIQS
jgi:hypothetical protein